MKMKQLIMRSVFVLGILSLLFINQSCSGDDPVNPKDETDELGHDEWDKVEFVFKEGHLHGATFHGAPDTPDNIKYFKKQQTYTFVHKGGKIAVENDQPIRLLAGNSYALIIKYYNKEGKLMNEEFAEDGMDKIHQHFFYVDGLQATKTPNSGANAKDIWRYTYRDTDPVDGESNSKYPNLKARTWDAKNPEGQDPIGLKGYFTIPNENAYYNFDLKVVLAHFKVANKLNGNTGKPFAHNAIPPVMSFETDLSVKIPIHIYSSIDYQNSDELKDAHFFPDAAKEFGASIEALKQEYQYLFELDPEGGEFWM